MKKSILCVMWMLCTASVGVAQQQSVVYETRTVRSEILKMERRYAVYLPPGYRESDQSYPVLYLLHGSGDDHTGWVQFGQVQHIADRAITEGLAARLIIVMPDANTGRKGYFNDIRGDFNYEDFFFDELIPHVEQTYRVRTDRRYRAVAGLSMGGGGTVFYALHRPDMFAAAAPLSATTGSWEMEQMKKRLGETASGVTEEQMAAYFRRHNIEVLVKDASGEEMDRIRQIRWYISCGDDDFLYEGNSRLHVLYRQNGIAHEYRVKDGGHSWCYWRM